MMHVSISVPEEIVEGLKTGASVAVNGVCLTVVSIEGDHITFDVMQETIDLTTLGSLKTGDQVNVERSLKVGDEVGGHLVSGHVHGTARILDITKTENNVTITLEPPAELSKYIFPKGFIALNGVSLTVISTSPLSVSLIPETLERTTFGSAQVGDLVNVEIDQQTRTIVDTIEHITTKKAGF
jgi:riboflavin synthase